MDMNDRNRKLQDEAREERARLKGRQHFELIVSAAMERRVTPQGDPDVEPVPEALLALPEAQRPWARYLQGRDARPESMKGYVKKAGRVKRMLLEAGFEESFASEPLETFPWHCVSRETAHHFSQLLRDRYPNAKTRENLIGALRRLVMHAASAGLMTLTRRDEVLEALPVPSAPRCRSGRELTVEEIHRLLAAEASPISRLNVRDTAIIAVFLATGLRVAEVASIRLEDLNITEDDASVFIRRTKSGRSRTVFLSRSALELVCAWLAVRGKHEGALFDSQNAPGVALTPGGVCLMLSRRSRAAGLSRHFSSHDFRRTFATRALRDGVDPFTVQRLLGHVNVQTTLIYDRRTEMEDREVVERLDVAVWIRAERRGAR